MNSGMKIGICDDDISVCEKIKMDIEILDGKRKDKIDTQEYYSGKGLIQSLNRGEYYDLLFLDCQMEEMNGFEVGLYVREHMRYYHTHIYYMSIYEQKIRDILRAQPITLLEKPIKSRDVHQAIMKSKHLREQMCSGERCFTFQIQKKFYKIPVREILYFIKQKEKILIVARNGSWEFYDTLEKIYQELASCDFVYSDRSCLINFAHLDHFNTKELWIHGVEEELPVARNRYHDLHEKWREYRYLKDLENEVESGSDFEDFSERK